MPGLVWPRVSYISVIFDCVTLSPSCHYFNWGNVNYKIYFRSWEGYIGGWRWDQAGTTFDYEQNRTIVLFMSFFIREIADQILEFLGSIISFACGIQARLAGGQNILLADCIYYLLFTIFAWRQRYHLSWLSLTTWHQSLIISYQARLQQILPNLAAFQPRELAVLRTDTCIYISDV